MGYQSGDDPARPVVNRPRGAAWRALQADGVAWEGQVLVLGTDVGLAARLIVTRQRLALARGGDVALEVARAWLQPAPELRDATTIRLSITPESNGAETETIDLQVRDGAQAATQLLGLLAGGSGGWEPASASPPPQTRPPQAAADGPTDRPARAGELPRQVLWTDIGQPATPPAPPRRVEPPAVAFTTRTTPSSPSLTGAAPVTVTDEAHGDVVRVPAPFATTRDYDWNLRPVRGMVDRSTRRRRGWGLRLGGLILLLAVAAYAGAMGVPSQPLDQVDRLTGGGAPEATTVAQIAPARATQTPSPAPGGGVFSGNAPTPTATLSPAEQTAVALGVGGGDDEDPTGSSEPAIGDIPPTATSEPPAATVPPTLTSTSTPEAAPPGVPTSANPPPLTATEPPALVATVESTSLPAAPPTAVPTVVPTIAPTAEPTAEPTSAPTVPATVASTAEPTRVPTTEPTLVATEEAAAEATTEPTVEPTPTEVVEPTAQPTARPTAEPTIEPTAEPTIAPTAEPTAVPTAEPTAVPTLEPTVAPTATSTPRPTPTAAAEPTATAEPTAIVVVEPPVTVTTAPTAEPTTMPAPTTTPAQPASEPAPTEDAAPSPTGTPPAPTETALPTVTSAPDPTAAPTETPTPSATVPAQKPSLAKNEIPDQVAVDGPFRFTLEVVERGEQLPDFALPPGNGEWVALVVHVRNWTNAAATLRMDDLSLIAEPDGTAIPLDSGTGFIASAIGLDPAYSAGDSVAIVPGEGQRLALVFLAPPGTTDVRLATGGTTIALDEAIDVSIGVGALGDPPAEPGLLRGTVARVIDGQTISVEIDGVQTEVRYLGIKAPVGDDCWASEATAANADLVEGQTVWIERERSSSDKKDRWLRDVYVNQNGALTLVSARLVAQGAATVAVTAPDTRFDGWLRSLSASAETERTGLWGSCGEQAARSPDGSALLRTWVSHALTVILPPNRGPMVGPTPL